MRALARVMRVELEFECRRPEEEITNVDLRIVISSVNDVDVAERGSTIAALEVE